MTTDKRYVAPLSPQLAPEAETQAKLNRYDSMARETIFRINDEMLDPGTDAVGYALGVLMSISADRKELIKDLNRERTAHNEKSIAHRQALDQLGKVRGELAGLKAAVRKLAENILDGFPGKTFVLQESDHPIQPMTTKRFSVDG